jgi:hypothetical protein
MAEKKMPAFSIGPKAKREVKKALMGSSNPIEVIGDYQKTRSLHSMFAKAFGTTPYYAAEDVDTTTTSTEGRGYAFVTSKNESNTTKKKNIETLDTDSVIEFLGHLGVSQYEVHKRVGDALQKRLEDELRKVTAQGPLLHLLQNVWPYATANPEFRPILWAVLRQLGDQTPLAVLQALAERDKKTGRLKHIDIFRPLPPLLKRLCWEADWTDKVPVELENSPDTNAKQYLKMVQSTLLHETLRPLIENYTSTPFLVESSDKFFVHSTSERKVLTSQRRALVNTTSIAASPTRGAMTNTASSLLGKSGAPSGAAAAASTFSSESLAQAGKAVSQIRSMLSDTARGSASYRPQLLHAVLSLLMAHHGALAAAAMAGTEQGLLAGKSHLHCTLVADILLSTSGPLPKEFAHVHGLARVLDDAVARGIVTDKDLIQIQECLRLIFASGQVEEEADNDNTTDGSPKKKKQKTKKEDDGDDEYNPSKKLAKNKQANKSLIRQLNQIITSGLGAMKDSDPQSLFLNPVTDAIAPGYSKIIKKPMSISTMENKIENNQYSSIDQWDADVRLMFKNCVDYNRGEAGQWFRGEAKRQLNVFKDEILPQAQNLFRIELQKRNPEEEAAERKRRQEEEAKMNPKVVPLDPITRKRKIDNQEYSLSMPAVAGMLLSDPFVVRILLDRILRSIRLDTNKGTGIPAEHQVIPSIMQLLFLAQWSPSICAVRGRQFIVSESGLKLPETAATTETIIPYTSLRQYLPLMVHLLRDAELEKRLAVGGDLHTVAQSGLPRPEAKLLSVDGNSPPPQIALAVFEGTYIYVCLPGNSQDVSLSLTFVKFSRVFHQIAHGSVWDERSFFKCLVPAILRHKSRLNKTVRDAILLTWMNWLKAPATDEIDAGQSNTKKKKRQRRGSVESAAHEYFIELLNEWASNFGNLLMPRDLLLKTATDAVEITNATEVAQERKFDFFWKNCKEEDPFAPVKAQYQRLMRLLPENHSKRFKEMVGIDGYEKSKSDKDTDAEGEIIKVEDEQATVKMDIDG